MEEGAGGHSLDEHVHNQKHTVAVLQLKTNEEEDAWKWRHHRKQEHVAQAETN